jgi:hypothetical protein
MGAPGWTRLLRERGASFLSWLEEDAVLADRGRLLAEAIRRLLHEQVDTPQAADAVWAAAPAVLSRCNDQATYELPSAPEAYAWLHLLDRYARTWRALEVLVERNCLPLARHGVRALDVGTGPGPSAFATHDFYQALVAFAKVESVPEFEQPPQVSCVEYDLGTNHFRHVLAEYVHASAGESLQNSVLNLCSSIPDFGTVHPRQERRDVFEANRRLEDSYYDEISKEWTYESVYTADEAHGISQSIHRYRLFVFSNFLTTVGTVRTFEPNLNELLRDARPGSVLLVLGGRGGDYPGIYGYVDSLASDAGFQKHIEDYDVSSEETSLSDLIYAEGMRFYNHLQSLSPNHDKALRKLHRHFSAHRTAAPKTRVRAFRKGSRGRRGHL